MLSSLALALLAVVLTGRHTEGQSLEVSNSLVTGGVAIGYEVRERQDNVAKSGSGFSLSKSSSIIDGVSRNSRDSLGLETNGGEEILHFEDGRVAVSPPQAASTPPAPDKDLITENTDDEPDYDEDDEAEDQRKELTQGEMYARYSGPPLPLPSPVRTNTPPVLHHVMHAVLNPEDEDYPHPGPLPDIPLYPDLYDDPLLNLYPYPD